MPTENLRHRIKGIIINYLNDDSNFDDVTVTKYKTEYLDWLADNIPIVAVSVETVNAETVAIGDDATSTEKGRAYTAFVSFHCWDEVYEAEDDYEEEDDDYNTLLLADKVMNRLGHISPTSSLFASGIISWGEPVSYESNLYDVKNLRRYIVRTQIQYFHF